MKLSTIKINKDILPKWIPIVVLVLVLVLALIGFADALYLTIEHYSNVIPPCNIGGCETVLTSAYSLIFGIPVSLIGTIYYFIMAVLLILYFDTKKEIFIRIPAFVSVLGLLGSIYFIIIMAFFIKAFCQYCAVSAADSIIIFSLFSFVLWKSQCSLPVARE